MVLGGEGEHGRGGVGGSDVVAVGEEEGGIAAGAAADLKNSASFGKVAKKEAVEG